MACPDPGWSTPEEWSNGTTVRGGKGRAKVSRVSGVRPRRSNRAFSRAPRRRRTRRRWPQTERTDTQLVRRPANADGRKSALRSRKPARETPPTGSIAYLYPGLPACSPQSRARCAPGRVTASPRPPCLSEPRGASRVAFPARSDQCRPPRFVRATCRATRRAVRPPTMHTARTRSVRVARELTSRGRVRRVAFWRLHRARLRRGRSPPFEAVKEVVRGKHGGIRRSFSSRAFHRISNLLRIPRANQNRDRRRSSENLVNAFAVTTKHKKEGENR